MVHASYAVVVFVAALWFAAVFIGSTSAEGPAPQAYSVDAGAAVSSAEGGGDTGSEDALGRESLGAIGAVATRTLQCLELPTALLVRLPDEELDVATALPSRRLVRLLNSTATELLRAVEGGCSVPRVVWMTSSRSFRATGDIVLRSYFSSSWVDTAAFESVAAARRAAEQDGDSGLGLRWSIAGAFRDDEVSELRGMAAQLGASVTLRTAAQLGELERYGSITAAGPPGASNCIPSAVIVLGNQPLDDGSPTVSTVRNIESAVAFIRRAVRGDETSLPGPNGEVVCPPRVVVPSGTVTGRCDFVSEAYQMAVIAASRGFANEGLLLEPKAHSTAQNAKFSSQLLQEHGVGDLDTNPPVLYVAGNSRHLEWALPMYRRMVPSYAEPGQHAWRLRSITTEVPIPELASQMRSYLVSHDDAVTIRMRLKDLEAGVRGVD